MPRRNAPYPLEFRQQMVELVRSGRTPEELSREFEPSTALFGGHCDNGLGLDFPAVLALFRAADIGFVHLDGTREAIPIGPDHRSP